MVVNSQFGAFVDLMGCKAGSLPTSYLGRLLYLESVSKDLWNPVIERHERKLERKLASWKTNYLSMGGCITLIKLLHGIYRFILC